MTTQMTSLTWEVTPKLHPPVCRRMKTVIVAWSKVDHHVKQVVIRTGQKGVPERRRGIWRERKEKMCRLDATQISRVLRSRRDLTALPLLWTQEALQTVGDPLHLLHLRVLHLTEVEDPPISWRDLTRDKLQTVSVRELNHGQNDKTCQRTKQNLIVNC